MSAWSVPSPTSYWENDVSLAVTLWLSEAVNDPQESEGVDMHTRIVVDHYHVNVFICCLNHEIIFTVKLIYSILP